MKDNFSDVEQRVKRYWYTDGIGELAGGGLFLLIGLYFAGHEWSSSNSLVRTLLDSSLVLLLIGGAYATRWLVNILKTRLTYPRTGYVDYGTSRKDTSSGRFLTGAIAVGVSMLLVILGKFVGSFDWLPSFTGLLFGIILMTVIARVSGLGRFFLLGGFCIILGLALSFSGLPTDYSLALLYGLTGLASMLSGGIVLLRYLRENPILADAERQNER